MGGVRNAQNISRLFDELPRVIYVVGGNRGFLDARNEVRTASVNTRTSWLSFILSFQSTNILRAGRTGARIPAVARGFFFRLLSPPDRLWSPQCLLFAGYPGYFQGG